MKIRNQLFQICSLRGLTKLPAEACWTVSYPAVLHDISSANKKLGWRSPHAAALPELLTPRRVTSLQRFVASLRMISAVSFLAWVSLQQWPVRMCPSIPSWTLPDVPTKAIILIHPLGVHTVRTVRLPVSVYPTYRKPFDMIFERAKTGEWWAWGDSNT